MVTLNTVIYLSWQCVKLPFKNLCLYPQTNSIFSCNQRTLSFQWAAARHLAEQVLRRRDRWLPSSKDTSMGPSKVQGTLQRSKWKECERRKIERSQWCVFWARCNHRIDKLRAAAGAYTGICKREWVCQGMWMERAFLSVPNSSPLVYSGREGTIFYNCIPTLKKGWRGRESNQNHYIHVRNCQRTNNRKCETKDWNVTGYLIVPGYLREQNRLTYMCWSPIPHPSLLVSSPIG